MSTDQHYWLWVTSKEYHESFTADNGDGWWTCDKGVTSGDLGLLYRTTPMSDIKYLFQLTSDAYPLLDDPHAVEQGWQYACDYKTLCEFSQPLTYREITADPYLDKWRESSRNFQGSSFSIESVYWNQLLDALQEQNPPFVDRLQSIQSDRSAGQRGSEKHLEDSLERNLQILRRFGYDLELLGRQHYCEGHRGYIDLLCQERPTGEYIVIELKVVRADRNTFGQITSYMGWAMQYLNADQRVRGLVVSNGTDIMFQACLKTTDLVRQINISQLPAELFIRGGDLT